MEALSILLDFLMLQNKIASIYKITKAVIKNTFKAITKYDIHYAINISMEDIKKEVYSLSI